VTVRPLGHKRRHARGAYWKLIAVFVKRHGSYAVSRSGLALEPRRLRRFTLLLILLLLLLLVLLLIFFIVLRCARRTFVLRYLEVVDTTYAQLGRLVCSVHATMLCQNLGCMVSAFKTT